RPFADLAAAFDAGLAADLAADFGAILAAGFLGVVDSPWVAGESRLRSCAARLAARRGPLVGAVRFAGAGMTDQLRWGTGARMSRRADGKGKAYAITRQDIVHVRSRRNGRCRTLNSKCDGARTRNQYQPPC